MMAVTKSHMMIFDWNTRETINLAIAFLSMQSEYNSVRSIIACAHPQNGHDYKNPYFDTILHAFRLQSDVGARVRFSFSTKSARRKSV